MRTRTMIVFALLCATATGCASDGALPPQRETPSPDGPAIEVAPGFTIIRTAPAARTISGEDLQTRAGPEITWRMLAASGSGATTGESMLMRTLPSPADPAVTLVEEGDAQTLHLTGVGGPMIAMTRTDAHREGSVSRFEPALLVGRAEIMPGSTVEGTASMIVNSMEGAGRERDRGTATRRLQSVSDETIRTPLGELQCTRVEIEFRATLRFAEATVRTTRWIVPGVGPVAEQEHERILVLGLIPRDSTRVMVRTTPLPSSDR